MGRPDRQLIGEDGDPEILQQFAQGEESAETSEGSGRCREEHGRFSGEGAQGSFVFSFRPAAPIDRVFQQGGVTAVVFRAGDEKSISLPENGFEFSNRVGKSFLAFEVLIEEGQGIVDPWHPGHGRPGFDGCSSRRIENRLVQRAVASAAAEGDKFRRMHFITGGLFEWRVVGRLEQGGCHALVHENLFLLF